MTATFIQLIRDSSAGDEHALIVLLNLFAKHQFSQLDQEQIHIYLRRLTDQSAHAIYIRGLLFDFGYGVPQNKDMAFLLMREAAAKGNALAIYEVGHRFLEGIGVDINYESARQWLTIAAIGPNYIPAAMYDLGLLYESGLGVQISYETAKTWYEQAAQKGHLGALRKVKS